MTRLLEKALNEVAKLPPSEQDALAAILLEELASEKKWSSLFAQSQDLLAKLAEEALAEHRAERPRRSKSGRIPTTKPFCEAYSLRLSSSRRRRDSWCSRPREGGDPVSFKQSKCNPRSTFASSTSAYATFCPPTRPPGAAGMDLRACVTSR